MNKSLEAYLVNLDMPMAFRLRAFYERYCSANDEAYLHLAAHAAFPIAITPDLLYKIWLNFREDGQGNELKIPYVAVSDLLLSSLYRASGRNTFEMPDGIRLILLDYLQEDPRFGEERKDELAYFLRAYLQENPQAIPSEAFRRAQEFIVKLRLERQVAAEELLKAYNQAKHVGQVQHLLNMAKGELNGQEVAEDGQKNPLAVATEFVRGVQEYKRGNKEKGLELLERLKGRLSNGANGGIRVNLEQRILEALPEEVVVKIDHRPVILGIFPSSKNNALWLETQNERNRIFEALYHFKDVNFFPIYDYTWEDLIIQLKSFIDSIAIFHFASYGSHSRFLLTDEPDHTSELAQLLKSCSTLRLVFLNGCNTLNQAEVFLEMGLPAVIVTTCSVEDGHATIFAKTFYAALTNHQNLEAAFKQAVGRATFRGQESEGDTIVHYRGQKLEDAEESPSWRLYVQENQAVAIKGWTFSNSSRLSHLINYYQGIKTKIPRGVRFLDQYFIEGTEANKYKHYLSEGVLPYYSLDAFNLEKGYTAGQFSETHLLQELLKGAHIEGGIISGKGGVGKTRMMLQMGLMAHEAGWNVVVLNERFEDEAELGAFLDGLERKKHLLLIDYIEECSWFHDSFLDEVKAHCNGVEDLRFLANCRNSFHYFSSSTCLDLQLDHHPQQTEYQQWVVQLILRDFTSQLKEQARKQFFVKKPSFAVFLRYLQERHSGRDLLEIQDFGDWLIKRFCRTVDPTRKNINEFGDEIKWLLCFPLTRAEKEEYLKVGSKFSLTLDTLIKDGWVEESNLEGLNTLLIIEDTVMDQLAVAYFERFSDLKTGLLFSFEWALKLEKGKNWMRSMHRIRDTQLLQRSKNTFFEVFLNGLKNANNSDFGLADELARTTFIDENQRFELITRFPLFFEALVQKSNFAQTLSYAMNWYTNTGEVPPPSMYTLVKKWLEFNWGEKKVVDISLIAKLISTYVKLYGFDEMIEPFFEQFFRSKPVLEGAYVLGVYLENGKSVTNKVKKYINDYLTEFGFQKEAQLVLTAWLNAGGDKRFIQEAHIKYLSINAANTEASFVIQAWLDTGGDKNIIQDALVQFLANNSEKGSKGTPLAINSWLEANGDKKLIQDDLIRYLQMNVTEPEAAIVFSSWLNANGDKGIIQDSLKKYLQFNAEQPDAQFVLCSWLNAGGDKAFIQESIFKYLRVNREAKEASQVISSWLVANGDKAIVKEYLVDYLQSNAEKLEVRHVIKAWLDSGGDPSLVQNALIVYLNKYAQEKEASFAIAAWLDAKGDKEIIQKALLQYLSTHAQAKNTAFVIEAWLSASGDQFFIKDALITYLSVNAQEREAQFVFRAWLNAGGDKLVIQHELISYLDKNAQKKEVQFVLNAWLDAGGDKLIIQNHLISYLDKYAQEKEASFMLHGWLNAGGDKLIIQNHLISYLDKYAQEKEASFMLHGWLNAGGDKLIIQEALLKHLHIHAQEKHAAFVIQAWLNASGDLTFIQDKIIKYLNKYAEEEAAAWVIGSWLAANGEKAVVQDYLIRYLRLNAEKSTAQYVFKAWLDTRGETKIVEDSIILFLERFAPSAESDFIIYAWLEAGGEAKVVQKFRATIKENPALFSIETEEKGYITIKQHFKNLIIDGSIDKVLNGLMQVTEENGSAELLQLYTRYNLNESKKQKDWLNDWQYNITLSSIVRTLIIYVNQMVGGDRPYFEANPSDRKEDKEIIPDHFYSSTLQAGKIFARVIGPSNNPKKGKIRLLIKGRKEYFLNEKFVKEKELATGALIEIKLKNTRSKTMPWEAEYVRTIDPTEYFPQT